MGSTQQAQHSGLSRPASDPVLLGAPKPKPLASGSQPVSVPVLTMIIRIIDFVLMVVAGTCATLAYRTVLGHIPTGELVLATWIGAAVLVVSVGRRGGYALAILSRPIGTLRQLVPALLACCIAAIIALFMVHEGTVPSRGWPVALAMFGGVLTLGHRLVLGRLIQRWVRSGHLVQRIALIGVNDFSATFLNRMMAEPATYAIAGVYDDRRSRIPDHLSHIYVRGGVEDLLQHSRDERIDIVVVALPLDAGNRIKRVLEQLSSLVVDVFLTTDVVGLLYNRAQVSAIGTNPVVSVGERPLKDWHAVKKAAFDRVVGGAILLCALPVMLVVAALIKLDSRGPVLFRQPRVGFDNRMFSIFKFRTMYTDMTDLLADRQTTRDDPRVTRIGRLLRRYSIDEVPQLLNVMQGNMSLVGPRPHAPNTKAADKLFADVVAQYAVRHRVKPGITGWAQVNGWRGETKTEDQLRNRVSFDLDYIQNWSLTLDIKILLLTVLREVRSKTAF